MVSLISLEELNELLRLRLRIDEDYMNANWDGSPEDPYYRQMTEDVRKLSDFIRNNLEPRIAESIDATINTEYADAFYEISSGVQLEND